MTKEYESEYKRFYVNSFRHVDGTEEVEYGCYKVGLFTKYDKIEGRGDFCGWYATEYYINTTLLAYYIIDTRVIIDDKVKLGPVNFKQKISDVTQVNIPLKEVYIGSGYSEKAIKAKTNEEALEKFKNMDFKTTWELDEEEEND